MLIKEKELNMKDDDIYFLEVVSDKIVINDNYKGIQIIDKNLNIIKKLEIFNDMTIYSSYISTSSKEILFFCPDNECVVYVDLENYNHKIINLKNGLENVIFSPIYLWNEHELILVTYKGEFYSILVNEMSVQLIDTSEVKRLYPVLYGFYEELTKYKIINVYANELFGIIEDKGGDVFLLNYHDKTKHIISSKEGNFLDIEIEREKFAIISEDVIQINMAHKDKILYPKDNYIFLKAKFLNDKRDNYFITLSSHRSNVTFSNIKAYKIPN